MKDASNIVDEECVPSNGSPSVDENDSQNKGNRAVNLIAAVGSEKKQYLQDERDSAVSYMIKRRELRRKIQVGSTSRVANVHGIADNEKHQDVDVDGFVPPITLQRYDVRSTPGAFPTGNLSFRDCETGDAESYVADNDFSTGAQSEAQTVTESDTEVQADEPYLICAELVECDEQSHAAEDDTVTVKAERIGWSPTRRQFILLVILLLVAISAAIGLGVGLPRRKHKKPKKKKPPPLPPKPAFLEEGSGDKEATNFNDVDGGLGRGSAELGLIGD